MTQCSRCHQCGTALRLVLDGEQWCTTCGEYRRYVTHGWTRVGASSADVTPCPSGRRCDEEEALADDASPYCGRPGNVRYVPLTRASGD